jgi:hypothetical protein
VASVGLSVYLLNPYRNPPLLGLEDLRHVDPILSSNGDTFGVKRAFP